MRESWESILLGVLVFVASVFSLERACDGRFDHDAGVVQRPAHARCRSAPGHTIKRIRYGRPVSNFVRANGQRLQPDPVRHRRSLHQLLHHRHGARTSSTRATPTTPNGTTANLNNDAMLHHFVLINPGRADPVCPSGLEGQLGERFFAAGNERSQMHLPGAVRLLQHHRDTGG